MCSWLRVAVRPGSLAGWEAGMAVAIAAGKAVVSYVGWLKCSLSRLSGYLSWRAKCSQLTAEKPICLRETRRRISAHLA